MVIKNTSKDSIEDKNEEEEDEVTKDSAKEQARRVRTVRDVPLSLTHPPRFTQLKHLKLKL